MQISPCLNAAAGHVTRASVTFICRDNRAPWSHLRLCCLPERERRSRCGSSADPVTLKSPVTTVGRRRCRNGGTQTSSPVVAKINPNQLFYVPVSSWTAAFTRLRFRRSGEKENRSRPCGTWREIIGRGNAASRRGGDLSKSTVKEHLRLQQAAPQQMLLQVLGTPRSCPGRPTAPVYNPSCQAPGGE